MCAHAATFDSDRLLEAALDALWRQWRAIGGAATGGPVHTQVDPEALCIASLVLESQEPRLWVAMANWVRLGAAEYWVDVVQWHSVFGGVAAIPKWGYWRELLAYVCAVLDLEKDAGRRGLTAYASGVRVRDVARRHEADLGRAGVLDPGSALPRSPDLAEWRQFHGRVYQRLADG